MRFFACCLSLAAAAAAPRNVLLMLVDDGGFESPIWDPTIALRTPNIEALANRSTLFERAYTAVSSCSPSRSAILSGLPTHQNGMYGLHQAPGNFQSSADVTSLPNLLNGAGYKTGILGKHHVGPLASYAFGYGTTAEHCWAGALGNPNTDGADPDRCAADYNTVARNTTAMRAHARAFLREAPDAPFFLYVGFGDVHRCAYGGALGNFCELYGAGGAGGAIADWTPQVFDAADVTVPPFLPDTAEVRAEVGAQWTAWSRLDSVVGALLAETAAWADDTLVLFFSDNGVPFPSAKTNLAYEQGQREPLLIARPGAAAPPRCARVVSALDLLPTVLRWANVTYPRDATAAGKAVGALTGASLLPLLGGGDDDAPGGGWRDTAFGSHQFHSLYAYYPTRSLVTPRYRLVHNLAYSLKFAILEDVEGTATWRDIARAGEAGEPFPLGWVYNYSAYMRRPEWQLFDVRADPLCQRDLAAEPASANASEALAELQAALAAWQRDTNDPWAPCDPQLPNATNDWLATHSEICSF